MKTQTVHLLLAFLAGMIAYNMLFARTEGIDFGRATSGYLSDLSGGHLKAAAQDSAVGQVASRLWT